MAERPMRHVFKLYPWEWRIGEQFGPNLVRGTTTWLEAPWKMLLSNKAILVILYQLFPECPYLLPAAWGQRVCLRYGYSGRPKVNYPKYQPLCAACDLVNRLRRS